MPHAHDLALLDVDELDQRLGDSRRELFNLRFQLATGQLDNPARVRLVRREVARILTLLREREIAEAEGLYVAPSDEEHEAARARIAAEDEAAAAARAAEAGTDEGEAEAEAEGEAEGEAEYVDEAEVDEDEVDEAGDDQVDDEPEEGA